MDILSLKTDIINILDACKAENIITIDMQNKASFADYIIIVNGQSSRHVLSMADQLYSKLKKQTNFLTTEGLPQGDWVLIDTGDIVVHLFKPEVRKFYNLESLWNSAPVLNSPQSH